MRKLVLLALLIATTTFGASRYENDQLDMNQIFKDACRLSKYDCRDLEQPIARRSNTMERMGIRGLYAGGNILWIDNENLPIRGRLTMFHETIHYLQFEGGKTSTSMISKALHCILEYEAFELTNQYAKLLSADVYIRELEDWRKAYRC